MKERWRANCTEARFPSDDGLHAKHGAPDVQKRTPSPENVMLTVNESYDYSA